MTRLICRRRAMRGVFVSLGLASTMGAGFLTAPAYARSKVILPQGKLVLSRSIERELKDGNLLSVRRDWTVSFERRGSGSAIMGSQKSVMVDAPERLEPIAQIERGRSLDDMFPILISDSGIILAAGNAYASAELEDAIVQAERILNVADMPPGNANLTHTTLQKLAEASARMIEVLPADLFYPRQPYLESSRPLMLPDGERGQFILRYETSADSATGLMRRAERQITTQIGSQERRSREVWTLS